jgi:hypothetical protein
LLLVQLPVNYHETKKKKKTTILFLGEKLVPISDCQMKCSITHAVEPRKVAKIQSDLTDEITKFV